ncbi:MAG TPA: hypothetical protein VIC06_03825 [Solirubrobacteraceae bacterium]
MILPDNDTDMSREYLKTHPWITFRLDLKQAPWRLWNHIGEAHSKCRHVARTSLPPALAQDGTDALTKLELIERGPNGVRARREIMLSFLPRVAPGAEDDRSGLFAALR